MLVVTGGARGIGAAIVEAAVDQGCAVCFSYVSDDQRAASVQAKLSTPQVPVLAVKADVADPDSAALLIDRAASLGDVVGLVNNAAMLNRIGLFVERSPEEMRRLVEVNVLGVMYACREVIRRWLADGVRGSVVNISSTGAAVGAAGEFVTYAASKGAVDSLTIGLGREYARHGIRVNAVSPGTVDTGVHATVGDPDRASRLAEFIPMGRTGEPMEIAEAVMWLLSERASFVTAANLRVSGGV
ncbi:SDR family NAD(P)-dependent oxidoreductase [Nocardioides humi]|uniref:SDR family oxidoreductase n=1 Tax=Nocardioides humi TaxID=449461 RepID=A0ABN2BHT1_9ACTN|nr:SDR family oxidoreductase [Nocardioides humi]